MLRTGPELEIPMSTFDRYTRMPSAPDATVAQQFDAHFRWEYADGRADLLNLYRKGKKLQWDAADRIDWSLDLDPENPSQLPDESIPIHGWEGFARLDRKRRAEVRRHYQSWQLSQFLHGEQGALVCTAKIVQQVPHMDAKYYAATQVVDEARHVEAYARLLHEKFELAYPINPHLHALIDDVLADSRWDMTYLGMQIIIEGLALAAFQLIRDAAQNRLAASVNAYVMQDEARHVAFGRLALRDYYPKLTEKERDEREEFVVDACYLMRDRFLAEEVWETLGLPVAECMAHTNNSDFMTRFRSYLFTRIVPNVKQIGLWGPRVRRAYADMGILGLGDVDAAALSREDEEVAQRFDRELGLAAQALRG
jgi:hypothetical protein